MSRMYPSIDHFNSVNTFTTEFFPTLRNSKPKGKKMAGKFKVVVKNGDTDYKWDSKLGYNKAKTVDLVQEFDSLAEALAEFLYSVNDEYEINNVSLTFKRDKKDKK